MKAALRGGRPHPRDVVHINAHATSTPQGDVAEGLTIGDPRRASRPSRGHVHQVDDRPPARRRRGAGVDRHRARAAPPRVPPTINLDDLDPEVDLDVATQGRATCPAGDLAALNNSFGFGGHNVALAFRSA